VCSVPRDVRVTDAAPPCDRLAQLIVTRRPRAVFHPTQRSRRCSSERPGAGPACAGRLTHSGYPAPAIPLSPGPSARPALACPRPGCPARPAAEPAGRDGTGRTAPGRVPRTPPGLPCPAWPDSASLALSPSTVSRAAAPVHSGPHNVALARRPFPAGIPAAAGIGADPWFKWRRRCVAMRSGEWPGCMLSRRSCRGDPSPVIARSDAGCEIRPEGCP